MVPNLALPLTSKPSSRAFAFLWALLAVCLLDCLDAPQLSASVRADPQVLSEGEAQADRAGLVYIIGCVLRPGAFQLDPSQQLTLVQALTLAGGPSANAALTKAVLIREQKGGRTVTTLNLKRLLRGQEPDPFIHDRDIVFVPGSTVKSLWWRPRE
jgi:protein involved in polysaccharide export with SLBB domain